MEFAEIAEVLRDKNVTYKWGFPTKLVVTYQSQQTNVSTSKEDIKRLLNWGLLTSPPPDPKPRTGIPKLSFLILTIIATLALDHASGRSGVGIAL